MRKLTDSEFEALLIKRNNALLPEHESDREIFRQAMLELGVIDREFDTQECSKCFWLLTSDLRFCTACGAPNSGFRLNDRNYDAVTTQGLVFASAEELLEKSCRDRRRLNSAHEIAYSLNFKFCQDCGVRFKRSTPRRWVSDAQKRRGIV